MSGVLHIDVLDSFHSFGIVRVLLKGKDREVENKDKGNRMSDFDEGVGEAKHAKIAQRQMITTKE